MAAITTAAEYQLIREAIQALTGTTRQTVSFTVDNMTREYNRNELPQLQKREILLARRLSVRNHRKRTTPDFSY